MKKLILFLLMFFWGIFCISAKELPKLYFEGDISNIQSKSDIRNVSVKYESENINFSGFAKLKLQGTSSIAYDKKNYNITFYNDKEQTSKLNVDFGWGEQSKYCLKANWIDKTHSRNIVTANIIAEVQKKYGLFENTPNYGVIDGYPIEIYTNGEFMGLYTLNIPKDGWLFNMDENNPNNIIVSGENWNDSVLFKEEATWQNGWELEIGEETDEALNKLNRVINFVIESNDDEFKKNLKNYINLDSLLNYYVICEFADLFDNTGKNMMLVTYDGELWYTSLYDLDTSWGTEWTGLDIREDYKESANLSKNTLFLRLEKNFSKEIAKRYFELRQDILTTENILEKFNMFKNSIPDETFKLEQARWQNIPGYDINQIEEFLNERIPVLDKYYSNFYDPNKNKILKLSIIVILILVTLVVIYLKKKK